MADRIHYTTKYINSGLGCKIHFSNSHSFSCVNYTDENNTTIRPNKVYSGSPSSNHNLVMCKRWEYSYSKSNLPAGVTSLTCHRKSALMDTIPANNQTIPVYISTDSEPYFKIWLLLLWVKWYYRRYDRGIFYGDEIWFEATYDSNYTVQSPEFYWTDANNVKHPITESTPLRVGIDVVGNIVGQNYINTPELRKYTLRFTGHEHGAEIEDPSESDEDDGTGFTKYKSNMTLADGTTSVDLQNYIKVKRISSTNSDANARTPEFLSDKAVIYEGDKLQIYTDCSSLDTYVDNICTHSHIYDLCIYDYTREISCNNSGGVAVPTVKYPVQNDTPPNWTDWVETTEKDKSTRMISSLNYGTITVNNNICLDVSFKKKNWKFFDLSNDPHGRTYGQYSSDTSSMEVKYDGEIVWWGIGETRFINDANQSIQWNNDRNILKNLVYFPSDHLKMQEWAAYGAAGSVWKGQSCDVALDYPDYTKPENVPTAIPNNEIYLSVTHASNVGSAKIYTHTETVNNKAQRARGLMSTRTAIYKWSYRVGGVWIRCSDDYDASIWY